MNKAALIGKALVALVPAFKNWLFPENKFDKIRGLYLLVAGVLISLSVQFFGAVNTHIAMELLADFAIAIGFADGN